ncbi:MAG: ATP-binding protein [Thermodesulfobacteriota bacterium]
MKIGFRRRLSYRQARNTILVAFLLGLILSGTQIGLDILKERERNDSTMAQVLKMIRQPATQAAYQLDGWLAKNVIKGLTNYRPVREVKLTDNFGGTLGYWSRPAATGRLKGVVSLLFGAEDVYRMELWHRDAKSPVGYLEVRVDNYLLAWNFIDRAGVTLIGGALRDGSLALVLTLIFYYTITRPLLGLSRRLSQVNPAEPEKGRLPVPPGHEQDEMGLLARAINGLLLGFGRSLARRQEAERRIRERETRLRSIMESVPDGVLTINEFHLVESLNPAAEKLFQWPAGSLLGNKLERLVAEPERGPLSDVLAAYRQTGRASVLAEAPREVTGLRRDGSKVPVELRFSEMLLEDRRLIVCLATDISERVEAQRELREMEEQLLQSQKMEAVGTLASGIAHDFNNLLQAISGYTQLLNTDSRLSAEHLYHLAQIERAVERAAELVQRLLTFSRKVKPELGPLDLNREVTQAVSLLERIIPKMIGIELDLAEDLRPVNGDPFQIEQVIMNLGANARDAMPRGGRLIFQTRNVTLSKEQARLQPGLAPGEHVRLRVTDTGQGMDKETAAHAFEPFFTTKGVGQGTGLGLSMVYGIIADHGGRITCQSRPGQGTTFEVLLPARLSGEAVPLDEDEAALEGLRGDETIMVVDDEKAIVDVARELLSQQGYRVVSAVSGEGALSLYREKAKEIDLVILDLGMPGMGGLRCVEGILALNPEAKVVIASGYQSDDWKEASRAAGALGFVGKPYRLVDLLSTVRRILNQGGRSAAG